MSWFHYSYKNIAVLHSVDNITDMMNDQVELRLLTEWITASRKDAGFGISTQNLSGNSLGYTEVTFFTDFIFVLLMLEFVVKFY